MSDALTPWVAYQYMTSLGMVGDPNFSDFITNWTDNPDTLALARSELQRVEALNSGLASQLAQRDHDQNVRLMSLRAMLTQFDEA